jgi:branched-chain amino acid transport system substrate-binding protein
LPRRFSGSRGTALIAAPALVLAIATSGCATSGEGIHPGETVTVHVSMPLRGAEAPDGQDVVDGAKLALRDADGRAGELEVKLVPLDDTGPNQVWSQAQAAANARRATEDSTSIAYIGDFDSGATRSSLPITNEAHLLQVSPAASAVDLVQPFLGAGDQIPEQVQPTGDRTFGRVIPSDEVQAQAGAVWAKRLGAKRVGVVQGSTRFGQAMATAFKQAATGIRITHRRADLVYDATPPDPRGLGAPFVPPGGPPIMATDARLTPLVRPGRPLTYITSAAEDPSELPPAGQRFVRDFRDRYGREPGRYAAYGYEAMAVVLDSIRRAGDSGTDRQAVIDQFLATTDRDSILGTYSIDEVGNTTLDRLAGYAVRNGRLVFDTALRAPR